MASDKSVMVVIRAARPTFRNKFDRIAFAVHGSFLAFGYVLTAKGPQAISDSALSNPSTVLVKCLVNDKFLVDALSKGSSEPLHLEIDVWDYAGDNGSSNYSDQFKNLDKLVKRLDRKCSHLGNQTDVT